MKQIKKYGIGFVIMVSAVHALSLCSVTKHFLADLGVHVDRNTTWIQSLNEHGVLAQPSIDVTTLRTCDLPLFRAYSGLYGLPYVSLGDFPTPVHRLEILGEKIGAHNVYIKRDDLSGAVNTDGKRCYGGNKIRKLEFELQNARAHGARTVMTFGCAGSNHAVATGECARILNLNCVCMLLPQENSRVVQQNLLLHATNNVELHYYTDVATRMVGTICAWNDYYNAHGEYPYIIPTGGSTPLGAVGFVNAVFELKEQIERGELAEPDVIYLACGSKATMVGLVLGCKVAGLATKIIGVVVEPVADHDAYKTYWKHLFHETNNLLRAHDANFPLVDLNDDDIFLDYAWCGTGYGVPTDVGDHAALLLYETEHIVLDGTYTAKAFASLLDALHTDSTLGDKTILFWNTYCGLDVSDRTDCVSYKSLPHCFHAYFEAVCVH